MDRLQIILAAAVVILTALTLALIIALFSVIEAQTWYTERIESLQSENSRLAEQTVSGRV